MILIAPAADKLPQQGISGHQLRVNGKLEKNEIAIFEGIHALSDDIAGRHPEAAKLYISARSNVNELRSRLDRMRSAARDTRWA